MPIYQYRCQDCHKRFELYISYSDYGMRPVACTHCGSIRVLRRIGRVRIARSEESRMDDMMGADDMAGLEDDPREMGRMMRKMSSEMGEELGPEFDEVVNRLESGQSPEDIEKAMPDLEDSLGGSGGGPADDFGDF